MPDEPTDKPALAPSIDDLLERRGFGPRFREEERKREREGKRKVLADPAQHRVPSGDVLDVQHRRELEKASAIDPEVIAERGYRTIMRPDNGDQRPREELKRLGIPRWARDEDSRFPGLLIPVWSPTGERVSWQYKPRVPVPSGKGDGKVRKYANVAGQTNRLDVHPRHRDAIIDPQVTLYVCEGIKKADSLTSRGLCAVAMHGVYGWRSSHGTLGDWEDVLLKGRSVVICFDADAGTNRNVLRAMQRLGKWLSSKGAKRVGYLITPADVDGKPTNGVDDFFAAGGALVDLRAAVSPTPPQPPSVGDTFTDARMAETIAEEVLDGRFLRVGKRWREYLRDRGLWRELADDAPVVDVVREFMLAQHADAVRARDDTEGYWEDFLEARRLYAVTKLAAGVEILRVGLDEFDTRADLLNTPRGVVDLRTGELGPHDPNLLFTKITGVSYIPGTKHEDWAAAKEALPADVRDYVLDRYGQALTGHTPLDDRMVIELGTGGNGKTTIMDGVKAALGDYAVQVPRELILAKPGSHPTELMTLRGVRLATVEELLEDHRLNVTRLKETIGTRFITARGMYQDFTTFPATHSLIVNTNHRPDITETDWGTWRRLSLVRYPYTYWPAEEMPENPDRYDRKADETLREQVRTDPEVHEAVLAELVECAMRWYGRGRKMLPTPPRVQADTDKWRSEADLVMAHFAERIVADPDRHIACRDYHDDMNSWLDGHEHARWSDKLLSGRLEAHDSLSVRMVKKQIKEGSESTYGERSGGVCVGDEEGSKKRGQLYKAWVGVRFRTADDDLEDDL